MKKTLLTAILLGASVAASAQELTFPLLILPMREQNRFYSLMHITIALQAM